MVDRVEQASWAAMDSYEHWRRGTRIAKAADPAKAQAAREAVKRERMLEREREGILRELRMIAE
jgi:hypothetical protein